LQREGDGVNMAKGRLVELPHWSCRFNGPRLFVMVPPGDTMRFLIVRTDIRTVADDDLAAAWAGGERLRDEQTAPEPRRQIVRAEDRDAAMVLARALSHVGAVKAGRQRVKVVRLESERQPRTERRPWVGSRPRLT